MALERMQGWAIIGILRSVSRVWGKGTISRLSDQFSDELKQMLVHQLQSSSTYPISLITEILHHIEKAHKEADGSAAGRLGEEAGRLVVDTVLTIYKNIGDLNRVLTAFPRSWQKFYPCSTLNAEVVSVSGTEWVVRIQDFPEEAELWMSFWAGWFRGYVEASVAPDNEVHVTPKKMDSTVEFRITT